MSKSYINEMYKNWTIIEEFEFLNHPFVLLECHCGTRQKAPLKWFLDKDLKKEMLQDKCWYCRKSNKKNNEKF